MFIISDIDYICKLNKNKSEILLRQKIVYGAILFLSLLWCAGILIAPLWAGAGGFRGDVSAFLYNFYSKNCHQDDARSFHLWGYQLGVCSRCTVIYFGFLLSTIVYPFVRKLDNLNLPALWILLAGAALVGLDAGLDILDIYKNTFLSRSISGSILGLILPFFIIPGSIRVIEEFFMPPKRIKSNDKNE